MTMVASRGMVFPSGCAGKLVLAGSPLPGCCVLMKRVRRSGVVVMPVISSPVTPVNKRRNSPVVVSATSSWLLSPSFCPPSVCMNRRPSGSAQMPSGSLKVFSVPWVS